MKNTKLSIKSFCASVLAAITIVSAMIPAVQAKAFNEIGYEVQKVRYESENDHDDLFYSDGYFSAPSTKYNEHLAALSMAMTKYSMNIDNPENKNDTGWYEKQSDRVKKFYDLIGFQDFAVNEDYRTRTAFDTIGIAAASRKLDDCTVIAATVRSSGYFLEWANNVYLGDGSKSDYMHEGWFNAAHKVVDFLQEYITSCQIKGRIKLWIAGYSRGGATMNITAGLLDNMIEKGSDKVFSGVTLENSDLYAYTFEAPQGANIYSQTVKSPKDRIYDNIWNIINPNDLVTKVAMSEWGFTRFGKDRYITTEFFDSANYAANRDVFKKLYSVNNKEPYVADDLKIYGIPVEKLMQKSYALAIPPLDTLISAAETMISDETSSMIKEDKTKSNYDANILSTLILEEAVKKIDTRANYCRQYQTGIKELLLLVMSDDSKANDSNMPRIITELYLEAITDIAWTICGYTGILGNAVDFNSITPLVGLIRSVYEERPNELLSMILCISNIFQNHEPNVTFAHLQAQDSYYINAYNEANQTNLKTVPLMEQAVLGRVSFSGFNDVSLNAAGENYARIEGHLMGRSDITNCQSGIAAGYYSYVIEEKMELFFVPDKNFDLYAKSYSKKIRHEVSLEGYCYNSNNPLSKEILPHVYFLGSFCFNSDLIHQVFPMKN